MAEALVLTLIGKISSTLTEEAVKALYSKFGKELSILLQVEVKLKHIASEFRVMQAFLSQIQLGERNPNVLETWLKEVREVAHDLEDIIDEYIYLIGKVRSNSDSFVKNFLHKPRYVVSFHDIATRLENFKPRLQSLSEMKNRYEIMLPRESSSDYVGEMQQPLVASSYLMDQEDLVGIGKNRNILFTWLKDVGNPARSIIVVWGMGGSGKTSLLHNTYKSPVMKGCFDFYVWITVSYKYQVVDILKRILMFVNGDAFLEINSMDMRNLQLAVRSCLEGKKYLIVLDDVWTKVLWSELDFVFPEGNHGSRVVITTRDYEVAELACGRYVLELKGLGEEESWDLFCRRAFRNEEERSCPPALEEWARKIVSKCQGLPLSLVAIGSLLSYRAKEVSQWKRFYDQINWELSRKENIHELSSAAKTLNLSYHYLPSHLKNCFLYCSIFPEDYLIEKDHIIRLWVAEGFIHNEGREWKALEEVAEEYYNELINRCLLQAVVWRDWNGSVINCRMHDIVRELTLTLSREQCFGMVVEDQKARRSGNRVRCLSVHEYDNDSLSGLNLFSLRTFIVFENVLNLASMPSVLSDCKFLRVLDLRGFGLRRVPDYVVHLFNLHYLSLRGTVVEELPKSIGKLRNLQTLDLRETPIKKLPRGVIELKNLRHLFVSHRVEVPKGFWVLKDLQTLPSVEASNELVGRVGDLSQLRNFGINEVRGVHCRELCASIAKMPWLLSLNITVGSAHGEPARRSTEQPM